MNYDFSTYKSQLKPNAEKLRQVLTLLPESHTHTALTIPRRSVRARHLVLALGSFSLAAVLLFTPFAPRLSPLAHAVQEEERAALTVIAQQEAREFIPSELQDADDVLTELSKL